MYVIEGFLRMLSRGSSVCYRGVPVYVIEGFLCLLSRGSCVCLTGMFVLSFLQIRYDINQEKKHSVTLPLYTETNNNRLTINETTNGSSSIIRNNSFIQSPLKVI